MDTLHRYCTHIFINIALDHLLLSLQPQSFLELPLTSSEQSLAEIYTILLEEYLQVFLSFLRWGETESTWYVGH
jgi:hypothetical protein